MERVALFLNAQQLKPPLTAKNHRFAFITALLAGGELYISIPRLSATIVSLDGKQQQRLPSVLLAFVLIFVAIARRSTRNFQEKQHYPGKIRELRSMGASIV